jgi:hypothetical protein
MFGFALAMLMVSFPTNAQNNKKQSTVNKTSAKVEVYYFHFTHRCNTCLSVEATAKQAVESLYADKIKAGIYTFKALNLDDAGNAAIAKKLGVGGQTLMVVYGNQKADITDKGFMNAHNLEKMKILISKTIANLNAN